MRIRGISIIFFLNIYTVGLSQYLANPSFEGTPIHDYPPPGWQTCGTYSTPDTQPESVFQPPSDGNSYLGMTCRGPDAWAPNTWEDVQAEFLIPLSVDSCYRFQIDLSYEDEVLLYNMLPSIAKFYGTDEDCQKKDLLWVSPTIGTEEWVTYEFNIHPQDFDYEYLIIETYYALENPHWGYLLYDNIIIEPYPLIDLGNDTTLILCENDSLILDPGSDFAEYLWQDGSVNPTFTVDTTGVYWVEVTTSDGCSAIDTINVTVEEYIDMVSEMIDSTLVCEGQEIDIWISVLNGAEPYSYEWTNLPDTTESVTIIADTTMYYYVVVTDNCGMTVIDSVKIVVVENPEIDLGNDTLICIDGSYTLDAGSGFFGYLWQDGSTGSTLEINQPGLYWVQVTSLMGCTSTDSIQIDLFPAIPLDIGNDTTLCEGETVTFNAGEGFVDYIWQDSSSDSTFTASTTGTYWVTVTDDNGCHATDTVYASFLSPPEISLGSDTSFCSGIDFYLTPGSGFISYSWQDSSTSEYYQVTEEGLYYVTVDNGCGEDTDSVYVEENPSPEVDLGNDTTLCGNESLMLEPGSFDSYLWQDNSTYPFYNVTNTGVYSVEVTNGYNCAASDEIYVIISNPQVNLGDSSFVCDGESVVLDAGGGFASYLWQDGSTNQTYTVNTAGTYWVTVIDDVECEGYGEVNFDLRYAPSFDLGPDRGFCSGDTIVLNAPDGDYGIYWNGEPGNSSYVISQEGEYTLSLVNECDSVTDEIYIEEYPLPYVDLGEDQVIFPGDEIILDAGEGFDEYVWQDGSGQSYYVVTENNIDAENPYYYVEVTQGICKSTDTVKIELFEVWVPKVITPNGDDINDVFLPDLTKWQGINKHEMIVFNRWGEKVWESTDFESGWDGKRNGRYVSEGTYFWVLEVYYGPELTKQTLKGSLSVLGTND